MEAMRRVTLRRYELTGDEAQAHHMLNLSLGIVVGHVDSVMWSVDLFNESRGIIAASHAAAREIELRPIVGIESRNRDWDEIRAIQASEERYRGRLFLAAQSCVIQLDLLGRAMDTARTWLNQCPKLRADYDARTARLAEDRFNNAFPDLSEVRNAIAHGSEEVRGASKMKANSTTRAIDTSAIKKKAGSHLYLGGILENDAYVFTKGDRVVRVNITEETHAKARNIAEMFFSAFPEEPDRMAFNRGE